MFVKINEFDVPVATPPRARKPRWPNAVHGLAGLAFLVAWLPITLLCWAVLGTMILFKLAIDARDYAGRALLDQKSA